MNSQLNPNAAVFIPVSPTRLLMMDDAIISASPSVEFEESPMSSSGLKHVDYFMRDNFSTIPNKIKELTTPSVCSTTDFRRNLQEHMEHISIDKLLSIPNVAQKDVIGELGKANSFGITNISNDNESESKSISGNNNTSTIGVVESNMSEDNVISETTASLKVEVSCFTILEEDSYTSNQSENESTAQDHSTDKEICPDVIVPKDEPLKGMTSQRKKSKSSRHRYKKRSKKVESNVENSEGFKTEHRRSPPLDLTFKPIQTFSDANPFGALQTPTVTTPTDQCYNLAELYKTPQETPKKGEGMCKSDMNQQDTMKKTPPSFILRRSPVDDSVVPFEELESPNELPPFVHPPNANRVVSAMELPKSPEIEDRLQILSSESLNHLEVQIDADNKEDCIEMKQDVDIVNTENQETSFTSENTLVNKVLSKIDLDTTERFLRPEYTISQPKKECESKLDINLQFENKTILPDDSGICDTHKLKREEKNIPAFNDIKTDDTCGLDVFSSLNSEPAEPEIVADHKTNAEKVMLDLFVEDTNLKMQETSFTNENTHVNKELMNSNSVFKKEFQESGYKTMRHKNNFDQSSKVDNDFKTDVEAKKTEINNISSTTVLKEVNQVQTKYDNIDSIFKEKTKEMRLELETHIPTSQTTPEELRNLVQGFEVIDKDELIQENYSSTESKKDADTSEPSLQIEGKKEEIVNMDSPLNETLYSILNMDYVITANGSTSITKSVSVKKDQTSNSVFLNAIDKFSEAEDVKLDASEHSPFAEEPQKNSTETTDCSSVDKEEENKSTLEDIVLEVTDPLQNPDSNAENKRSVEKEVIPPLMEINSSLSTEYVQSELAQSMIVTETLITFPQEVHRVPIVEMTEVPLMAGTDPTTFIPSELKGKKLQDLPELDIFITEKEAEADSREKTAEEGMDKEEDPVELKKPVDGVASKSSDTLITKKPAKQDVPTTIARPAAAKTTTSITKLASGAKTTTPAATAGKTSTVKPTASITGYPKLATSGGGSAKPTTTSVATSKPNASGVAASKSAASSTVPSKPAAPGVNPSKSTTSSVAPSKHSASGVPLPKSSVSSAAPSKSSASTATSSKTSSTSTTPSKPAVSSGAPSKPVASTGAPSKLAATLKPPASNLTPSKPAASNLTPSKSAASSSTTTKPDASSSTATKPAATITPAKKPATASTVKQTGTKTTTTSLTKPTVTSTTSLKSVPKQLPVSETTTTPLKSSSKPSTPTSDPTTPTTPESPTLKSSTEKSPPKPETKSPLPDKSSTSPKPMEKSSDKKPATKSDVKSLFKKAEAPKSPTPATTKPSPSTKPSTAGAKTVGSATKSQTPIPYKTVVAKPAATSTKQKQVGVSDEPSNVSGSVGAKKSTTATVAKTAEKSSKEPADGKMAANGKTAPAKTSSNIKTDPKGNTKNGEKSARSPSKKPEEGEKEEKPVQVQEHKVSTTNEIKNHTNDEQSMAQPLIHIVPEAIN